MSRVLLTAACMALCAACSAGNGSKFSGEALYGEYCAACHGQYGEGDGPVASVISVSVPNLRTLAQRNGGTFPVDAVTAYVDGRDLPVAHGTRQMPIWGNVFRANEAGDDAKAEEAVRQRIAAIVDYVAQLQYK